LSSMLKHTDQQKSLLREVLTDMLSLLQAQRWNYQTSHWQSQGEPFYGDHLMFQRLYESLDADIDGLAEKILGLLVMPGDDAYPFDNTTQATKLSQWLESWNVFDCPYKRSLQSERDMQTLWARGYEVLKDTGSLSLGLDDWVMSTASAHETNLYLLQQRMHAQDHMRKASQDLTRAWYLKPSSSRRGREFHAAEDKESD